MNYTNNAGIRIQSCFLSSYHERTYSKVTSKLIKLKTLEGYKIHSSISEKAKYIESKIHSMNYDELFVLYDGEFIIGLGMSWANSMHPKAKYMKVISKNQTDELLEALLDIRGPQTRIVASCSSNELSEIERLKRHGFTEFRKTYEIEMEIDELLQKIPCNRSKLDYKTLQDVLENKSLEKALFQLVKENYEQTHLDNPAENVPWEKWKDILIEDAPDYELSKVILTDGQISGYSFIHQVAEEHVEVGWMGYERLGDVQEILHTQLLELKNKNIKTVGFEIDTTDHYAYSLKDLLNLGGETSWNSYSRELLE